MEAAMLGVGHFRVMRRRICRLLSPTKPGPVDDQPPVLYMPSTSCLGLYCTLGVEFQPLHSSTLLHGLQSPLLIRCLS